MGLTGRFSVPVSLPMSLPAIPKLERERMIIENRSISPNGRSARTNLGPQILLRSRKKELFLVILFNLLDSLNKCPVISYIDARFPQFGEKDFFSEAYGKGED